MNFPIGEGSISSNTFGLANIGNSLNLVNLDYRQSVSESHPNLVLKFSYLKDLENMNSFNISGVNGGK